MQIKLIHNNFEVIKTLIARLNAASLCRGLNPFLSCYIFCCFPGLSYR